MYGDDASHPKRGTVIKAVFAVLTAVVAAGLIFIALTTVAPFFWSDGREGLGNAGYLMIASFYLLLAGPFAVIAFALGDTHGQRRSEVAGMSRRDSKQRGSRRKIRPARSLGSKPGHE